MPKELKPCPFCGGEAETIHCCGWKVYCPSCGIKTPDSYSQERYVIEFWNKRA